MRVLLLGLTVCLLSSTTPAIGQAPALKCLAVDATGNVQVTWQAPLSDCGAFFNYYIYFSPSSAGPYVLIDSVASFAVTTYSHVGANADQSSGFYYIESSSLCPNTLSDTVETMFLSVSNTALGTADLFWNNLHTPSVPTNTEMYLVFREDTNTGLLQVLDSSYQIPAFTDPYTTCKDSVDYQVFMIDSSGCISASNIAQLEPDIISPPVVIVDSVTVDAATGSTAIGWQMSAAADVIAYVITTYNIQNSGFDDVDTVYGIGTTFYLDLLNNLNPNDSMLIYAIDTCGNASSPISGHSTIELKTKLDTCRGEATLEWTQYFDWPTGVAEYDIYVSQNGGSFQLENTTPDLEYVFNIFRGISYCFFIRARDGSGTKTSSSNIRCSYNDTVAGEAEPFPLQVEARDSVKNLLFWDEDIYGDTLSYQIYRSIDGGAFTFLTTLPYGTISYEDMLDPISDHITGVGSFCYFVVPVRLNSNSYGCIDTSDTICVEQFPKFVIANTFTPNGDGRNDVFRPIRMFVQETGYLLIIYNRWGQNLFETTDINLGWDGLVRGRPAQNDAYVYYVTFTIRNGLPVQKAGTVLLLR